MDAKNLYKFQRSSLPKYVIVDKNGRVVGKADTEKEYMELRKEYLKSDRPRHWEDEE